MKTEIKFLKLIQRDLLPIGQIACMVRDSPMTDAERAETIKTLCGQISLLQMNLNEIISVQETIEASLKG